MKNADWTMMRVKIDCASYRRWKKGASDQERLLIMNLFNMAWDMERAALIRADKGSVIV